MLMLVMSDELGGSTKKVLIENRRVRWRTSIWNYSLEVCFRGRKLF